MALLNRVHSKTRSDFPHLCDKLYEITSLTTRRSASDRLDRCRRSVINVTRDQRLKLIFVNFLLPLRLETVLFFDRRSQWSPFLHFERNPVEINRGFASESPIRSRDPTGSSNINGCWTSCWFLNIKPEVNRFVNGRDTAFLVNFPIIILTGNCFIFQQKAFGWWVHSSNLREI